MFEESVSSSIPSIWASMNSWFTPTVLFVLLNLMIATIFFTSSLATQNHHHQHTKDDPNHQQQQQTGLARSPSVLQRLRSVNLYAYISQEPHLSALVPTQFNPTPDSDTHYAREQTHPSETETHKTHFEEEPEEEEESPTLDEIYSQLTERHVNRTKSDTRPAAGEMPQRLPTKMRKSASLKSPFAHFEEDDVLEARRPATVKEGNTRVTEADDEVDAKADDFINRFKEELKLQRLDSRVRYKEMISRGSGK